VEEPPAAPEPSEQVAASVAEVASAETTAAETEPQVAVAAVEAPEKEEAEAEVATEAPVAEEEEAVEEAAAQEEPAAPPEPPPPPRVIHGELIVLFGGKGGVGKSILATNIACSLASETGAQVALVDLDLQFGDLAVLLNLPQVQSIADLIDSTEQIDSDLLFDVMIQGPPGVWLLPTTPSPELADLVTSEHVQTILSRMRSTFDFVVVDTSSHLGDTTLTALDMASHVLLVSALSIPSVKNAKLALRLFETLSISPQSISLVLNRGEAHTEFNKEAIESNLKFPVSAQIPHDPRTVVNSINRGTPFVISNPEAEISQRVRQLVGLLLPAEASTDAAAPRQRRLFGRSR
jgi:pilus assembly protein CpaE